MSPKTRLDKIGKIANLHRDKRSPSSLKTRSAAEVSNRLAGPPACFPAQKGVRRMTRLVLAMVAAMALTGCQHSGQQAIDPFWGRTRGRLRQQVRLAPPIVSFGIPATVAATNDRTPGMPLSNVGPPPATPNLLPAPIGSSGTVTPVPATPAPAGSGVPYNYVPPPSPRRHRAIPPRALRLRRDTPTMICRRRAPRARRRRPCQERRRTV